MIGLVEVIVMVLVLAAVVLPVWWIILAYNKRVAEIEELREDVDKMKEE